MRDEEASIVRLMDRALEVPGGITLHSESRDALTTIRWKIYNIKRRDRTLTKQTMGGVGTSKYDALILSFSQGPPKGWRLRLLKSKDLFDEGDITITEGEPESELASLGLETTEEKPTTEKKPKQETKPFDPDEELHKLGFDEEDVTR